MPYKIGKGGGKYYAYMTPAEEAEFYAMRRKNPIPIGAATARMMRAGNGGFHSPADKQGD